MKEEQRYITPNIAINDLKNYLKRIDYTITDNALSILYDFEINCYKYDFYPFEEDFLLPLINRMNIFRKIIDKYGGDSGEAIIELKNYYEKLNDSRDSYQIFQSLYDPEPFKCRIENCRYDIINWCIRVKKDSGKIITDVDLLMGFLDYHDELYPIYTNSEFTQEKLHTTFKTLSHVMSDYYMSLWVKFDDIRKEILKMDTYDIAISFAGEDRDIAKNIAEKLDELGFKVFYDDFAKADLWGKDLYTHLTEIYKEKAKYCLMIISENYAKKSWTNLERKAAQAKAFSENKEYILPLRLDNTDIPGLLDTTGYIDYHQISNKELIKLICIKLSS